MKIDKILDRNTSNSLVLAVYECEFCGHTWQGMAGDNDYFHNVYLIEIQCPECNKSLAKNGSELK